MHSEYEKFLYTIEFVLNPPLFIFLAVNQGGI